MYKRYLGRVGRAARIAALLSIGQSPTAALANGECDANIPTLAAVAPGEVSLGQTLTLQIDGVAKNQCNWTAVRLRLDGHTLDNKPDLDDLQDQKISFKLDRSDGDQAGWGTILGSPPTSGVKSVPVSLEMADKSAMRFAGSVAPTVRLVIFTGPQLLFTCLIAVVLGVTLFVKGSGTGLLRDPSPDIVNPLERTYSLGRCQFAFWLLLLTVGFVAIWLITGDYKGILTSKSLLLLGISGVTALGASSIDASKAAASAAAGTGAAGGTGAAEIGAASGAGAAGTGGAGAAQAPPPIPKHVTFLDDILTDKYGPALQRLQVFVWTLLLGLISVVSMYRTLSLPEFDDTLLALTGISSGLYVGFKVPENPT